MSNFIKEHKAGITGTIIFHAILIVLFIVFGYTTPLPLPAEEGILINFGDVDEGAGQLEPRMSESIQEESQESIQESVPESNPSPTEDGTVTQDFEDAPAVKEQGVKEEKTETKPKTQPKEEKEEKPEPVEERKVNENALFPGRDRNTNTSTSEGETEGNKNQGSTTGSVDSKNHIGGNSSGTIGFSLEGRSIIGTLPKPDYNQQIQGKVVVEISVDKEGNVTRARAILKGSTIQDENLWKAAENAAKKAKFNRDPGSTVQHGTITYYFKLQ